jgi:uncharacterized iron-regulated membrane protein
MSYTEHYTTRATRTRTRRDEILPLHHKPKIGTIRAYLIDGAVFALFVAMIVGLMIIAPAMH